jgi:hypothetical protein
MARQIDNARAAGPEAAQRAARGDGLPPVASPNLRPTDKP